METTTYIVEAIDLNGCKASDSVLVEIEDKHIVIPTNVITPDGNGINDTWYIENIDAYPQSDLKVFNRWGEIVYSSKGYLNNWKGKNMNGDVLPDGTYIYIISFPDTDINYTGTINILRNE
jgi:gliding motility-associated-like protein